MPGRDLLCCRSEHCTRHSAGAEDVMLRWLPRGAQFGCRRCGRGAHGDIASQAGRKVSSACAKVLRWVGCVASPKMSQAVAARLRRPCAERRVLLVAAAFALATASVAAASQVGGVGRPGAARDAVASALSAACPIRAVFCADSGCNVMRALSTRGLQMTASGPGRTACLAPAEVWLVALEEVCGCIRDGVGPRDPAERCIARSSG